MQRKLALLGAALALLGFALWFSSTRGVDATPAVEQPARPTSSRSSPEVATEPSASARVDESLARPAATVPVRVRSSAGVPLAFVELEREGKWSRVDLVDGGFDAGALGLPLRVRAPGHVARALEKLEAELVLEPDALLVIEGATLRTCLSEVVPEEPWCRTEPEFRAARERAIASGWLSEREYAVAIAYDRLEPLPPAVDVLLVRGDRRRMSLRIAPRAGLRARWELPCGDLAASTPLEVQVVRPPGPRGPLRLVLDCRPIAFEATATPALPFGELARFSSDLYDELELAPGEDRAVFPCALTGRQHHLAAIDTSQHAYGRLVFTHDGSARVLELREAFEVRGRVLDAATKKRVPEFALLVQDAGQSGWILEARGLAPAADGSFVLRGPSRAPANESMPLEPPASWEVCFDAPGYERVRLQAKRGEPCVLDLGDVELRRSEGRVVLGAGHGLAAKSLDGEGIVFADEPSIEWATLPGAERPDGSLEIVLSSMEGTQRVCRTDLASATETFVAFERPLGTTLFVHVPDDVRSFTLGADGLYRRLPEDSLELTLRTESLAPEGKPWRIGWSLDGAWVCVGQLASEVAGNQTRARLTVPRGAQQLWWSSTGLPPDLHGDPGGFQAIQGTSITLVLR